MVIPKDYPLSEERLKIAVLNSIEPFIKEHEAWKLFHFTYLNKSIDDSQLESESLYSLIELIKQLLTTSNKTWTRENVENLFQVEGENIVTYITPHVVREFSNNKKQIVRNTRINNAYQASHDMNLYLMKNSFSKGNDFKKKLDQKKEPVIEMNTYNGNHSIRAKYDNDNIPISHSHNLTEQKYFETMLQYSYNVMDDGVVDMLDIACFLSMYAEKDQNGFIEFHYNDAAVLKNSEHLLDEKHEKVEKRLPLRLRKEVMSVMERVAALPKLWFSIREGIIREEDDLSSVKYKDWQKMFEIGKVRYLYDEDDNPLGIYALQIRPTDLLTPYLEHGKAQGFVELSAIEFHPFKEKYEKRLTRFLYNYFYWSNNKIRNIKIKSIIHALDFASRMNGVEKKEKTLSALQNLKEQKVIEDFKWIDIPPDENAIGKRGWFQEFLNLRLRVTPSEKMKRRNQEKQKILEQKGVNILDYNNSYTRQQSNHLEWPYADQTKELISYAINEIDYSKIMHQSDKQLEMTFENENVPKPALEEITGKMILEERKRRKLSLRKMANEIDGISPSTIQRFEKSITVNTNNKTTKKLLKWYTTSSKLI